LPYKIGAIGNIMHAQAQKTPWFVNLI
jgi:hypothetical protein